jgi:C4-dicarboxylate-specific signal transduction histidine kinase
MDLPFVLLLILTLALGSLLLLQIRKDRRTKVSLQKHYEEITHAARLALVGEITASVTHEVTQPLSAILSNVDTALLVIDRTDPDLEMIRDILIDVRKDDLRAHGIVQRLRPMLRKRTVQFEHVDLNKLVSNVTTLIQPDAKAHDVTLKVALDPDVEAVPADPVHIEQVLLNILINSLHAFSDIPAHNGRTLEVRTKKEGECVTVSVLDNGQGIATENLGKLFESFFTTRPNGIGLGLSIARSIVKAHGGEIWAENRPTGGAAFMFTVPLKAH